ncbi:MAG: YciI family protein [Rhodospirillales bacterium]|nr:YciI family protein [Rhodospirillales bacterium]MCW8970803.1 YciI family protein [Rhodospirillales bacterium]MCW9002045.1 YciI family protein [Rhodospirillales bacterium]MCW9039848.1 YciI family protein [Rhodospirillales bacterium]
MQFFITALDGTDDAALDRRMAVREKHIENARRLKNEGFLIAGGAILDDDGRMIGSGLIAEAPDKAAVEATLNADPYVTGGVWQKIDIRPFKLAALD